MHSHWKWVWVENENTVNLKSASFVVIMLLHEGLTHIHSQKKPRLRFTLIKCLYDITLHHNVTRLRNLCLAASLACKTWFSTAALLLVGCCCQWWLRHVTADQSGETGNLEETAAFYTEGEYNAAALDSVRKLIKPCKHILVVTQNKMMILKMSIVCLL